MTITQIFLVMNVFIFACFGISIPEMTFSHLYGTSQEDTTYSLAIDSSGDLLLAVNSKGNYGSYQNFDQSYQTNDIFITKVKPNGEPVWTVQLGTPQEDVCLDLWIDEEDCIYFAGYSAGNFNYTNAGGDDVIMGKLSNSGEILWEFQYGSIGTDQGTAVTVDSTLGIVWAAVRSNEQLGSLGGDGYFDAFLFSLRTDGEPLYFIAYGSAGNEVPTAVTLYGSDIILAGMTDGSLSANNTNGTYEIFMVRYSSDLSKILSASQLPSAGDDGVYSVTTDEEGNIYMAGYATGIFHNQSAIGFYSDYLLVKLALNGTLLGFHMNGSEYDDLLTGLQRHGDYLYTCGTNSKNINNQPFNGGTDIFVACFDLDLNLQWMKTEGSANYDAAASISIDKEGSLWVTGTTDGTFDDLQGYGGIDALLLSLTYPGDSSSDDWVLVVAIVVPITAIALLGAGVAFWVLRKKKHVPARDEEKSRLNPSYKGVSYGSAMEDPVSVVPSKNTSTTEYSAAPSKQNSGINNDLTDYVPIRGASSSSTEGSYRHIIVESSGWEINYKELQLLDKIGEGAFGVVYKGKWRKRNVAVKQLIINTNNESEVENFRTEAMLMRNLRPHKNVLMYLGICSNPQNPLCIVTEFMSHGNLWNLLQDPNFKFTNKLKVKIIKGIAEGMCHLTQEKIVHRDLAARNILLDDNFEPRISDFGMSRMLSDKEQANKTVSNVGPIRWMAPENLLLQLYSEKSDVWSFGILMHEVLKQTLPYEELSALQVATLVGSRQKKLQVVEGILVLSDVMKSSLEWEPEERPSFELICEWLDRADVDEEDQVVVVERPRSRTVKNQNIV